MADEYGTEPMFDVPEEYRPPKRPPKYPAWREYKGKRISCHDCVMDLVNGSAGFMAEPATWLRDTPVRRDYFCARHAHRRKLEER